MVPKFLPPSHLLRMKLIKIISRLTRDETIRRKSRHKRIINLIREHYRINVLGNGKESSSKIIWKMPRTIIIKIWNLSIKRLPNTDGNANTICNAIAKPIIIPKVQTRSKTRNPVEIILKLTITLLNWTPNRGLDKRNEEA